MQMHLKKSYILKSNITYLLIGAILGAAISYIVVKAGPLPWTETEDTSVSDSGFVFGIDVSHYQGK
ncbi:MAG: hypothetical protein JKY54_14720, partial [Flavobacteriales bacterium]|nr:hypothetical protein [Flavobacteriales bacterium]